MRILGTRAQMGPNVFSHSPVFVVDLDLEGHSDIMTSQLPGFTERLIARLPGLKDHFCSLGFPGGFAVRLREGTYLGHVVEHVALELQTAAGQEVTYGQTRSMGGSIYRVVFSCRHPRVAELAARTATELVLSCLMGTDFPIDEHVQALTALAAQCRPGPSTNSIIEAARKRNIPVIPLDDDLLFQLGHGARARRVQAAETSVTSNIAADIATDKVLTKRLLAGAGLPVPEGTVVENAEAACEAAAGLGYPVVVKPADGCKGKGVSLCLQDKQDVLEAFALARQVSTRVIVEKQIRGRDYRVVVVGGTVVAAAERKPPVVMGDSVHSVAQLIDALNADPLRGDDHEKPLTRVVCDDNLTRTLSRQGYDTASVPMEGAIVHLRWQSNLSTGGTSRDVTDALHPSVKEACLRAARVVGLDIAGIDVIMADIARPISNETAIIEVNAAPGLRMHLHPAEGQPHDVGSAIVESLFPVDDGRIPLVAVTGTNGKTTTVRMLAAMFREAGMITGHCTTDGAYIQDQPIAVGDLAGPRGVQILLQDPAVEAAVVEVARGGLIRRGLGYDCARVGVITNISEDHLGQDGVHTLEDLAHVKSVVIERVSPSGYAVLNADDPATATMAAQTPARVAYFSLNPDNMLVRHALGSGELCARIARGALLVYRGGKAQVRIPLVRIPATMCGKAVHNVENALAAALAGIAAGVPPLAVKGALQKFRCDLASNPGRLNLFDYGRIKVMVDYGHNPAGVARLLESARAIDHTCLVGVVAAPGDRSDETIRGIGRVAGQGFDRLVFKEDRDKRGRTEGEVSRILLEGAMTVRSRNHVQIVEDEAEAVARAVREAPDGALITVFYEKLDVVLDAIESELGPLPGREGTEPAGYIVVEPDRRTVAETNLLVPN